MQSLADCAPPLKPQPDERPVHRDALSWVRLLSALQAAIAVADDIWDSHTSCPYCDLCDSSGSIAYVLKAIHAGLEVEAPDEVLELISAQARAAGDVPVLVEATLQF